MKLPLVSALFLLLCLWPLSAADSDLPEGNGKEAVQNNCTDCHSVERIKAQRLDEEGWDGILREMMETGASINPEDIQVIVEYLTKNFGPDKKLNVNTAGALEIASVLHLTSADAKAIVEYRNRNGKFKNLTDLEKVDSLAEKIEAKKALIEF